MNKICTFLLLLLIIRLSHIHTYCSPTTYLTYPSFWINKKKNTKTLKPRDLFSADRETVKLKPLRQQCLLHHHRAHHDQRQPQQQQAIQSAGR